MTFEYNIAVEEGIQTVYFKGELIERNQANELSQDVMKLLEANELKFILDLTELRYMNSSGLNVLINTLTKVRKAGGEVVITSLNKKIQELLIITKLHSMFTVTANHRQAIEILK